jgi:hypothetical protein
VVLGEVALLCSGPLFFDKESTMRLVYFAAVLCVIVSARCVGQEVALQQLQLVAPMQPVVVEHSEGDRLSVSGLGSGDLPEQQYRRFSTHTVFVAKGGDYLIRLGDKFAVIRILDDNAPVVQAPPAKPVRIWAYMGKDCAPCRLWEEVELPILRNHSAEVDVFIVPPGQHNKPRTPTFIVQTGDNVVEREGYEPKWNTAAHFLNYLP